MELADILRRRRMVRSYRPDPVPADVLARVVGAASAAPTAGNSGGQHLVVVTSAETRSALARLAGEDELADRGFPRWLSGAPVHIVLVASPDDYRRRYATKRASVPPDDWPVPYWWVDAGGVLLALLLAAVDEGLGAGFLGVHAFDPGLDRLLGLPAGVEPVGLVTLGFPAPGLPTGPPRPGIGIHREQWTGGPMGNGATGRDTSLSR